MKALKLNRVKTSFYTFGFLALCSLVSCNQSTDSKEVADDLNDEKFSQSKEDDAEYLVAAAEINLEEIKLGQLVQTKSTNADVIALGKMMEAEHTKAQEELKAFAAKNNISIPTTITNDGQDAYDKLNKQDAKDFDKKYCDMMVDGHKDAVKKFEDAADKTENEDIRSWANSYLESLRNHYDHSVECQKKCEEKKS